MSEMNFCNFTNRVRAFYNIDYHRLPEMPADQWSKFREDPPLFFICCDDELAKAIWREVQHRSLKHDHED